MWRGRLDQQIGAQSAEPPPDSSPVTVGDGIQVAAKRAAVDSRPTFVCGDGLRSSDRSTLAHRHQHANWTTVPADDKGFTGGERAHDASAVVAQLALGDLLAHATRL